MKKEVLAAIAAALAIWFFVMGFELGIYKERRAYAKLAAQTNPPPVSSTAPSATPSDSAVLPTAPGNRGLSAALAASRREMKAWGIVFTDGAQRKLITAQEARSLKAAGKYPGAGAVLTPLAREILEQ